MGKKRKLTELTTRRYEAKIDQAREYGKRCGYLDAHQAAMEGVENLRAFVEEGSGPLSGEFAGRLTPNALADELGVEDDTPDLELAQAFEDGYWHAVHAWIETYYPSIDLVG